MKRIALDLDGVLADFHGKLTELGLKKDTTIWRVLETIPNFFMTLKPMYDAKELYNTAKALDPKMFILTALPYPTGNLRTAADDKRDWVHKHLDPDATVVTVVGGKNKGKYANPNTILVDDLKRNIDVWTAAGGVGILHTTVESSIILLKRHA